MGKALFSLLPRPVITCILCEKTVEDAAATIRNGEFDGAPAFAIDIAPWVTERIPDDDFRRVTAATKRPVMFLCYRGTDRWPCTLSDEGRVALLTRAAACGAAAVDFTADTFDLSPLEFTKRPEAVDKQMRAIDRIHTLGAEVVMSSHIFEPRTCEQVLEHLTAVEKRGADFVKIVTKADTDEQFVEAVKTTLALRHALKKPFIHLVSGVFALPHRYLSPTLGNSLTFCVQRYSDIFLTPQPPVRNMLTVLNNMNFFIDR